MTAKQIIIIFRKYASKAVNITVSTKRHSCINAHFEFTYFFADNRIRVLSRLSQQYVDFKIFSKTQIYLILQENNFTGIMKLIKDHPSWNYYQKREAVYKQTITDTNKLYKYRYL